MARHNTLILALVMFLLSLSSVQARVIEIKSARAVIEGAKALAYEVTLKYNGNKRMNNRLIDGRYLLVSSIDETFMDSDSLVDDHLKTIGTKKDTYKSPVVEKDGKVYWDVLSETELTLIRTFSISEEKLEKSYVNLFRHEIINGERSWGGRLNRNFFMDKETDEHPVAGLGVLDILWGIARGIRGTGKAIACETVGQDSDDPDFMSNVDFYFIVDIRLKDSLNYSYRTVFETKPITLPSDLSNVDVSSGDVEYQENGRTVEEGPGFTDLTQ